MFVPELYQSRWTVRLIYKFSLHNGTVAMYPEAFTYGLGRAAAYIMNTNKTAKSFFNPAVNIRSNHAYKAVSRRQPLVLGKYGLLWLARVRLAVVPEDENIDLDWYDVINDGDEFITLPNCPNRIVPRFCL